MEENFDISEYDATTFFPTSIPELAHFVISLKPIPMGNNPIYTHIQMPIQINEALDTNAQGLLTDLQAHMLGSIIFSNGKWRFQQLTLNPTIIGALNESEGSSFLFRESINNAYNVIKFRHCAIGTFDGNVQQIQWTPVGNNYFGMQNIVERKFWGEEKWDVSARFSGIVRELEVFESAYVNGCGFISGGILLDGTVQTAGLHENHDPLDDPRIIMSTTGLWRPSNGNFYNVNYYMEPVPMSGICGMPVLYDLNNPINGFYMPSGQNIGGLSTRKTYLRIFDRGSTPSGIPFGPYVGTPLGSPALSSEVISLRTMWDTVYNLHDFDYNRGPGGAPGSIVDNFYGIPFTVRSPGYGFNPYDPARCAGIITERNLLDTEPVAGSSFYRWSAPAFMDITIPRWWVETQGERLEFGVPLLEVESSLDTLTFELLEHVSVDTKKFVYYERPNGPKETDPWEIVEEEIDLMAGKIFRVLALNTVGIFTPIDIPPNNTWIPVTTTIPERDDITIPEGLGGGTTVVDAATSSDALITQIDPQDDRYGTIEVDAFVNEENSAILGAWKLKALFHYDITTGVNILSLPDEQLIHVTTSGYSSIPSVEIVGSGTDFLLRYSGVGLTINKWVIKARIIWTDLYQ
ncbi:MAG: hypothetical protein HC877_19000 [Thioploca sp.]|nr:hypothetical protein [Thioploca sp.]